MFPYHVTVTNIQVVKEKSSGVSKLIVLSDHEVKTLPLNRCYAIQLQSCGACVALQDPYCAWNVNVNSCVDHREHAGHSDASSMIQNVFEGKHAACSSLDDGTIPYGELIKSAPLVY